MNKTITEAEREIKVLAETDVLVAGAGVAGCAAALASARAGAKTILLERNGCLGGVATAGLMANIGNCLMDRDGRFIINGIPREIIDRMVARDNQPAAELEIRTIQKALLEQKVLLGSPEWLKDLGLV